MHDHVATLEGAREWGVGMWAWGVVKEVGGARVFLFVLRLFSSSRAACTQETDVLCGRSRLKGKQGEVKLLFLYLTVEMYFSF